MKIIVCKAQDEMDAIAAKKYAQLLEQKPNAVLGFATGSTPVGLYKKLAELYKNSQIDFSNVTTFNLDEYVGIQKNHVCSYYSFMHENLFDHINVPKENINIPNGQAFDPEQECLEYEEKIKKADGIDLQILGVGHNGHIGFNEPNTPFDSITHVVKLDNRTREANSRFFDSIDDVPEKALSMGIKTIMNCRSIIFMAKGADKADIVYKALTGPVTPKVPASILQLHPDVLVLTDSKAGQKLQNA